MTHDIAQWIVTQGIGAVLALVMFLVYRKDAQTYAKDLTDLMARTAAQHAETAHAWMAHGRELGVLIERTAGALERIEQRLERGGLCPVSQVTSEAMREAKDRGLAAHAAGQVGQAVREAVKDVIIRRSDK